MKKCFVICFALAWSFSLSGFTSIYAQEKISSEFTLEEITITAEKRETTIQETSMAITAIEGKELLDEGVVTIGDALKNVPNISINMTGSGGFSVAIRGLGSDLPVGMGESAVSTNYDGIYNVRSEAGIFGYFDLDRIEVLRGPQGTLYGRNATGGVVNVVTKDPTIDSVEGYAALEVGSYNLTHEEGAINVPISQKSALRIAFASINREGYMSTGSGDQVGTAVRGKFAYYPNDEMSAVIQVGATNLGGVGGNTLVSKENWYSGNYFESTATLGYNKRDFRNRKISANVEIGAGPGVIAFMPSYEVFRQKGYQYEVPLDSMLEIGGEQEQTSAELRYSSRSDAKIQWVAGLYYYDREEYGAPAEGRPYPITRAGESKAAFGQVTYPITNTFRLIAGVREGNDYVMYDNKNKGEAVSDLKDTYSAFNWKAALEVDLAEDVMSYFTAATGHRPGGFNEENGAVYEQEELLSFEWGVKSRLMNNRLQLNGDIFYYDYNNYQAADSTLDENQQIVDSFFNVDKVKNYGAEIESDILIGNATTVRGSVSYLHSRYDSPYELHETPFSAGYNMEGVQLAHAPDWSVKGSIEHTFALSNGGTLKPNVSARWTDSQLISPYPGKDQTQEAYTIIDANLKYGAPSDKWTLNGWIKNATDKIYKAGYASNSFVASSPRTYGVILQVMF